MLYVLKIPMHWHRPLLMLVLLQIFILFAYSRTALGMAAIWWRSDTYAHGMLVPLVSIGLIWWMRSGWIYLRPHPGRWAWLLMMVAGVCWLLGDIAAINVITQFALVGMLILAVPAVLGWEVASTWIFPLSFLLFSVPVGDFMLPQLMSWTATMTVFALRATGIPVYQEGLQFVIPSGTWSVVEACSGIRYLIAAITVGSLFAYINYHDWRKRLLFVGISAVVPLFANWIRAYLIVLLGHISGNSLATGVDHLIYGWVFFGLVMGVLFFVGMRWADSVVAMCPDRQAKVSIEQNIDNQKNLIIFLCLGLVALIPHGANLLLEMNSGGHEVRLPDLQVKPPWQKLSRPPSAWRPSFENATAELSLGFVGARSEAVGLHVSYYRRQNYQHKLVASDNVLVKSLDPFWVLVEKDKSNIRLGEDVLKVDRAILLQHGKDAGRLLVWRFYWAGGVFTSSDYVAKWEGAMGRLGGWGDDAANIVIYTPLPDRGDAVRFAEAILQEYLDAEGDALISMLWATRGRM